MIQLFNWLRRGSLERGLDRELQYHFDRRVADLTAAGEKIGCAGCERCRAESWLPRDQEVSPANP